MQAIKDVKCVLLPKATQFIIEGINEEGKIGETGLNCLKTAL